MPRIPNSIVLKIFKGIAQAVTGINIKTEWFQNRDDVNMQHYSYSDKETTHGTWH